MDNAKQHWKILQKLESDLANRVRSFMVIEGCGNGVIVATEDGQAFWLGMMWFGRIELRTATKPIPLKVYGLVHMAQSESHILLLNKRGQIYSMGRNNRGQLGLGTVDQETCFSPLLIPIQHKFTSVRCGREHSVALTEDGKVWAWGKNRYGQVGVPKSTRSIPSPHQISELDPHRVIAVECGGCHSLALTDQGEVYVWGSIDSRLWSESCTHSPIKIPTPSPVQSMASGYVHTLLLTRTGEVWACGWNRRCQLGLPKTTVFSPSLVKVANLPSISQIASHPAKELSIAMSSDQRCFAWGKLRDGTCIFTPWEFNDGMSIFTPRELPPFYSTVESSLSFCSLYHTTPHSFSIPETPLSPLSARMSRMFDNPETSPDVQFVVEQRTIHAHQIILSNSSDYYAQMFSKRWMAPVDPKDRILRVTIPDHLYKVFHAFLLFLYTDYLEVHSDLLPELFELANQYLESDLSELCLVRMRTTITPENCCLFYQLTERHSLPELQQDLLHFIADNRSKVFPTEAYRSMDADLCKKLGVSIKNIRR